MRSSLGRSLCTSDSVAGDAQQAARARIVQVVSDALPAIADAVGDSRLMIQLGLVLGFLYAAFLSVWFWATRLRGRPGREQEGA